MMSNKLMYNKIKSKIILLRKIILYRHSFPGFSRMKRDNVLRTRRNFFYVAADEIVILNWTFFFNKPFSINYTGFKLLLKPLLEILASVVIVGFRKKQCRKQILHRNIFRKQ